jgi:hypothetical protein
MSLDVQTTTQPPSEQRVVFGQRIIQVEIPSLNRVINVTIATGKDIFKLHQVNKQYPIIQAEDGKELSPEQQWSNHESTCRVIAEFTDLNYEEAVSLLAPLEVLEIYFSIQGDFSSIKKLISLTKK